MTATVYSEKPADAGFLVSEAEGPFYARDALVLAANAAPIFAGTVVAVLTASKKVVPFNAAGADGSQNPIGFSLRSHDINTADRKVAIWDGPGEVRAAYIVWPAGISDNDKATAIAALVAKGIKFR